MTHLDFTELVGADPVDWLLDSDEPYAVWATLTGIGGLSPDDRDVEAAHASVVRDAAVRSLVTRMSSPTYCYGSVAANSAGSVARPNE